MKLGFLKTNKLDLSLIILILGFYTPSFFITSDFTNYDGSSTTSSDRIGYFLQTLSIIISACLISYRRDKLSISYFFPKDKLSKIVVIIFLTYYFYAFLLSFQSLNPITSFHLSLRGIIYIFIGMGLGNYFTRNNVDFNFIYWRVLSLFSLISMHPIFEALKRRGLESTIFTGVGGSYNSLCLLISAYLVANYNLKNINNLNVNLKFFKFLRLSLTIVLILLSIILNSFTSILSFAFSYSIILFFKMGNSKSFRKITFLILSFVLTFYLILFVDFNDVIIARKDLATLLSGTNRLEVFKVCSDNILTSFRNIIGDGFTVDYSLRKSNELLHTCHNSFLTSFGGLGIFGGFLALIIPILLGLLVFRSSISTFHNMHNSLTEAFAIFLFSSAIFGLGSPIMPGTPTQLVFLIVIGTYFLNKKVYSIKF